MQEEIEKLKTELKALKSVLFDLITSLSNADVSLDYDEYHKLDGVDLNIDGLYQMAKRLKCTCGDTPKGSCNQNACIALMSLEELTDFLDRETDPKYIPCGCSENVSLEECRVYCRRETLDDTSIY